MRYGAGITETGMPETMQFSAAAQPLPDSAQNMNILRQVLCIRVASMVFCIDLEYVERALFLVLLQPVPQGPDYLAGLMSVQGRNIPVIDLSVRIGLADIPAYTTDTPLVICKHEGQETGLVVSEVLGIESVRHEAVQMADEFGESQTSFMASLNTSHGPALLLDVKQALEIDWGIQDSTPLLSLPHGTL